MTFWADGKPEPDCEAVIVHFLQKDKCGSEKRTQCALMSSLLHLYDFLARHIFLPSFILWPISTGNESKRTKEMGNQRADKSQ